MKASILKELKGRTDYISGQALAQQLDVSRTAIWKMIKQLEKEGYKIEAVPNRGYRLIGGSDIISEDELSYLMDESWLIHKVYYYEQVESTNTTAKQLAEQGAPSGSLVIAESQRAGKGRRGKGWISPKGSGIWMSLILKPDLNPLSASMLTLVAALAVSRGIDMAAGMETQIKWPNDIIFKGKKICGILTEMSSELDHIHYIVTGIGINVNITELPDELKMIATSCYLATGRQINRVELIGCIMKEMKYYYELFMIQHDLSLFLDQYHQRLANKDKEVKVIGQTEGYQGVARGITETGELLVEMEDGSIRKVISGEVSVRGIYGYI